MPSWSSIHTSDSERSNRPSHLAWVVSLFLGCGPSANGGATSGGTSTSGAATTGGVTSSVGDDSTGQSTGALPPGSSTSATTSETSTSGGLDHCDSGESGEAPVDLGECDPAQSSASGQLRIERVEATYRTIDIDASCEVLHVESRDPAHTVVEFSCPAERYLLDVHADPAITLAPDFAVGSTLLLRVFREGYLDSTPPTHIAVRNGAGDLLLAYSNHLPVPESVDPNYLDWFAPLTFSEVDLGCDSTEPPDPPCTFIVDPCPAARELRGLEFSDGVDEVVVNGANSGVLGPFELRGFATRIYPVPDAECGDRPFSVSSWVAFRVP